jgi:predicted unusual protein kinase regulating ubiquinone biosynthesis (AarF/ABC1/UbiB family)
MAHAQAPAGTEVDLGRIQVQSQLIQALISAATSPNLSTEAERLQLLERALDQVVVYRSQVQQIVLVRSLVELEARLGFGQREIRPLTENVDRFLRGIVPNRIRLVAPPDADPAVHDELRRLRSQFLDRFDITLRLGQGGLMGRLLGVPQEARAFDLLLGDSSLGRGLFSPDIIRRVRSLPASQKLAVLDQARKQVTDFQNQLAEMSVSFVDQAGIQGLKAPWPEVLRIVVATYLKRMPGEQVTELAGVALADPVRMDNEAIMRRVLPFLGPIVNKVFQVIARDARLTGPLGEILRRAEDALPFEDQRRFDGLLAFAKADLERAGLQLISLDPRPVSAGSVAQVHKGLVRNARGESFEIAFRVLRDQIRMRVERDFAIAQEITRILTENEIVQREQPQLAKVIEAQGVMTLEETDLLLTHQRQNEALRLYSGEIASRGGPVSIRVPRSILFREGLFQIQEWVPGQAVSQALAADRDATRELLEAWTKRWFSEVIFGTGYFHADPQLGNVKIDLSTRGVMILDHGLAGRLTPQSQSALRALFVASALGLPKTISGALMALSANPLTDEQRSAFEALVEHQHQQGATGVKVWIDLAANAGLDLDEGLFRISRGLGTNEVIARNVLGRSLSEIARDSLLTGLSVERLLTVVKGLQHFDVRDTGALSYQLGARATGQAQTLVVNGVTRVGGMIDRMRARLPVGEGLFGFLGRKPPKSEICFDMLGAPGL